MVKIKQILVIFSGLHVARILLAINCIGLWLVTMLLKALCDGLLSSDSWNFLWWLIPFLAILVLVNTKACPSTIGFYKEFERLSSNKRTFPYLLLFSCCLVHIPVIEQLQLQDLNEYGWTHIHHISPLSVIWLDYWKQNWVSLAEKGQGSCTVICCCWWCLCCNGGGTELPLSRTYGNFLLQS